MGFKQIMADVALALDVLGATVIVVGIVSGFVIAGRRWFRYQREGVYRSIRRHFGRSILLGVEILVAADLIRIVAIEPELRGVLVLGLVVLIRTFLSFSLEVETYGRLPWRGLDDDA
jgi:uncharacterized membrane protein